MAENQEKQQETKTNDVQVCKGIVKSVTDGNRLIVRGPMPNNGLPQEKIIIISGIRAPTCGKETRVPGSPQVTATTDQPGAFNAREFVRKMFIGKAVKFSINYQWP